MTEHRRETIDNAEARLRALAGMPDAIATEAEQTALRTFLAKSHIEDGRYELAIGAMQACLLYYLRMSIGRPDESPTHLNAALAYVQMGELSLSLSRQRDAFQYFLQAARVIEERGITDDRLVVSVRMQIALCSGAAGKSERETLAYCEQALRSMSNKSTSLFSLTELASLFIDIGDAPGARACFERQLKIQESLKLMQENPLNAQVLIMLAKMLTLRGDLLQAGVLLQKAKMLFVSSDQTATMAYQYVLAEQAELLLKQRKYCEATTLIQRAYRATSRIWGERHVRTIAMRRRYLVSLRQFQTTRGVPPHPQHLQQQNTSLS